MVLKDLVRKFFGGKNDMTRYEVVEGRLSSGDGLSLDIKIEVTDEQFGEADSVAEELRQLLNEFIAGYDDDGGGERLDVVESGLRELPTNVVAFQPRRKAA